MVFEVVVVVVTVVVVVGLTVGVIGLIVGVVVLAQVINLLSVFWSELFTDGDNGVFGGKVMEMFVSPALLVVWYIRKSKNATINTTIILIVAFFHFFTVGVV